MKEYFLNTVLGTLCLQIKNGAVRRMGFVENMAGEELDLREILHGIAFGKRICLRPGGTTFQRLVWTEIQKIPPGETGGTGCGHEPGCHVVALPPGSSGAGWRGWISLGKLEETAVVGMGGQRRGCVGNDVRPASVGVSMLA